MLKFLTTKFAKGSSDHPQVGVVRAWHNFQEKHHSSLMVSPTKNMSKALLNNVDKSGLNFLNALL